MQERIANIVFSTTLLVACAILVKVALGFEESSAFATQELSSSFFPLMLLGGMIVLSLINLAQYFRGNPEGDVDQKVDLDLGGFLRVIGIFLITVASYYIWNQWGFMVMGAVMMVSLALILQVRSPWVYAGLLAYSVGVKYLFELVLLIQL